MLIVTYHALGDPSSPVSTSAGQFKADLSRLYAAGYTFVSLDQCADWLEGSCSLPPRSAVVTFDDGYASLARVGLPILTALRVPATVFVIAGRVGDDNAWPGQWKTIARMPLAGPSELRDLVAAGVSVGAHSWSHAALPSVDEQRLRREVIESGDHLEQIVGASVKHFAYPYGRRGAREVELVSRRYRTGLNATPRVIGRDALAHDLPRLDCHDLRLALGLRSRQSHTLRSYLIVRRGLRFVRRYFEGHAA